MLAKYYRYFRWLSLDIVLGAILFLRFLGELYQISFSFHIYLALGIAVWLIYTLDHLLDVRSVAHLSPRREFHKSHFSVLVLTSGILMVIGLINILFLPLVIIKAGAVLLACCVIYLMTVYFFPSLWFKEILIALGYTMGIFLAPMSILEKVSMTDIMWMLQLGVLAFINLLIFSFYEQNEDRNEGFGSLAIKLGDKTVLVIWSLLILSLTLSVSQLYLLESNMIVQAVYMMMTILLSVIAGFRGFFGHLERFRIVGDGIFFVPVIFLI